MAFNGEVPQQKPGRKLKNVGSMPGAPTAAGDRSFPKTKKKKVGSPMAPRKTMPGGAATAGLPGGLTPGGMGVGF